MTNPIVKHSDPILRNIAREIPADKILSKQVDNIIQKMLKVAYGEQKDKEKPIMVGLAAPQIGISKRIILVDVKANGKGKVGQLKVYLNPEIIWTSSKKRGWYEGCYSIPRVCGIVYRPESIKIKAYTTTEGIILEKHGGYVARIFQHEIDHLNGKLITDLISNPDHLHKVTPKEFPLYRNKQAWRNWPKKHPLPIAYSKLKKI